ncbi:MAG: hypothetical protein P1U58_05085, partial [Verrucomicrobiales bacterium]|nr:hypothetical protein [Verrucomicrobiales bacterium]
MNQRFRIPVSRWSLIWLPLLVLIQVPSILYRFSKFREESDLNSGLFLLLWILAGIFWLVFAIRQFRTADVILIEEEEITVHSERGERIFPSKTVTTVTDDQIAFHLFFKKGEISLSKKTIPSDLAKCLEERILADSGANKTEISSPITSGVD